MKYNNFEEVGESMIAFNEHIRAKIKYPRPLDRDNRLLVVPIELIIGKNKKVESIKYASKLVRLSPNLKYTQETTFIDSAFELLSTFDNWTAYKMDGAYVKTERLVHINFFYHKAIFEDSNIILNPDIRPEYPVINSKYEYTIQGRRGCDGIAHFLFLIDEFGSIIEIEPIYVTGKTNFKVSEHSLLELGKWIPAKHQNRNVKSQMDLTVYT